MLTIIQSFIFSSTTIHNIIHIQVKNFTSFSQFSLETFDYGNFDHHMILKGLISWIEYLRNSILFTQNSF